MNNKANGKVRVKIPVEKKRTDDYLTLREQTDVLNFVFMASDGSWEKSGIPESWRKFAFNICPKLRRTLERYRAICEITDGKREIELR